jgi:hypothetical protein
MFSGLVVGEMALDGSQAQYYRDKARHVRELANGNLMVPALKEEYEALAEEYERLADQAESGAASP